MSESPDVRKAGLYAGQQWRARGGIAPIGTAIAEALDRIYGPDGALFGPFREMFRDAFYEGAEYQRYPEIDAFKDELEREIDKLSPELQAYIRDPERIWELLRAQKWGSTTGWRIRGART